jgi:nucleotide-binding universal stress UspA family protein
MYMKILVALDVHEPEVARKAMEAASALAASFDSDLRLVYVAGSVMPIAPILPMAAVPQLQSYEVGATEAAELHDIAAGLDRPAAKVTTAVRVGSVYPELLAEAEGWGADLIVACAHRLSMATYLLGSTAAALSRHAKCTVMIVRSPLKATFV